MSVLTDLSYRKSRGQVGTREILKREIIMRSLPPSVPTLILSDLMKSMWESGL